jgi:hypothetical protein
MAMMCLSLARKKGIQFYLHIYIMSSEEERDNILDGLLEGFTSPAAPPSADNDIDEQALADFLAGLEVPAPEINFSSSNRGIISEFSRMMDAQMRQLKDEMKELIREQRGLRFQLLKVRNTLMCIACN